MILADKIAVILRKARICAGNEKQMQDQVADVLFNAYAATEREYSLSKNDRIDFLLFGGIGIECKYGHTHSPASILRQLKRYADSEAISQIILVSTHPINLPATLSGKPVSNISVHLGAF